jgi:hypothetical protein
MSVFIKEWRKMQQRWLVDGRPATPQEHTQIDKYVFGAPGIKPRCPGLVPVPPPVAKEATIEIFGTEETEIFGT